MLRVNNGLQRVAYLDLVPLSPHGRRIYRHSTRSRDHQFGKAYFPKSTVSEPTTGSDTAGPGETPVWQCRWMTRHRQLSIRSASFACECELPATMTRKLRLLPLTGAAAWDWLSTNRISHKADPLSRNPARRKAGSGIKIPHRQVNASVADFTQKSIDAYASGCHSGCCKWHRTPLSLKLGS